MYGQDGGAIVWGDAGYSAKRHSLKKRPPPYCRLAFFRPLSAQDKNILSFCVETRPLRYLTSDITKKADWRIANLSSMAFCRLPNEETARNVFGIFKTHTLIYSSASH